MSYLFAVAVVAGAPHAPAAYHAVERPILLARLQGEWVRYMTEPWGEYRTLRERLVIRGDILYRTNPTPVGVGLSDHASATVRRIEDISPTSLRTIVTGQGDRRFMNGLRATLPYSLQGDTLTLRGAPFQRVPPARDDRAGGQGR
jgi:hypothetical protein